MTTPDPYTGHHRRKTVPSYWDRPGERRHLVGTPGFDWFTLPPYLQQHAPPMPPVVPPNEGGPASATDDDPTGRFSLAELGFARTGEHLVQLPAALTGPDPEPTGPLQLWEHSGPLPILPPPRETDPPSMRWAWALGVYLLLAVAAALFTISLGGG